MEENNFNSYLFLYYTNKCVCCVYLTLARCSAVKAFKQTQQNRIPAHTHAHTHQIYNKTKSKNKII